MSLFEQTGDASVAKTDNDVSSAPPITLLAIAPPNDTTDKGVASDAEFTTLANNLEYTLTVGQALERFVAAKRKPPSPRSIQRYCVEGQLAAQKIRTIFGAEWLINERALAQLIASEPIVSGDAGVANNSETATTATLTAQTTIIAPNDTTDKGVASDAMAATAVGEKRTIAEVLIENARLLAQVEGRDAIITELKEDRSFLREEVREGRRTRDDVKNIAERMLDTLKTMAVGRLSMTPPPQESVQTTYTDAHGGQGSERG